MIVAAARTDVGVTVPVAFFIDSTELDWFVTELNSFINSYCNVVYSGLILLYSIASNQEFHCPTATNKATVAYTGLHKGEIIFVKIVAIRLGWLFLNY